jgi:hypothetical protein
VRHARATERNQLVRVRRHCTARLRLAVDLDIEIESADLTVAQPNAFELMIVDDHRPRGSVAPLSFK